MEIWTSQGRRHQESENGYEFDSQDWKMAQYRKSAGKKRRVRATFILLGLLFIKFSVLLVFVILLFVSYYKLNDQVSVLSAKSCESEWLEFEKHCYFFTNFELTWKESESVCLNQGSNLAIITSKEEQNFLESNRKQRVLWIGLSDLVEENTFRWVDGSRLTPTSFQYWDEREPNDAFNVEDCVQMWRLGKWNDFICNASRFAVCEKPLK